MYIMDIDIEIYTSMFVLSTTMTLYIYMDIYRQSVDTVDAYIPLILTVPPLTSWGFWGACFWCNVKRMIQFRVKGLEC